jgi:hypothetical protein
MFRFWFRELVGWVLILIGLGIFYICLLMLVKREPEFFTAPTLSIIGIVVFRGGIHLLKVAVAARVAMQASPAPTKPAAVEKRAMKTETPWDW